MSRLRIILGALLAAGVFYALGLHWQAFVLILLGMLFEGVFWLTLLGGGRHQKADPNSRE